MFDFQLSNYISSYMSWTSITALYSQYYPFIRNYIAETIDDMHQQYLENYVLWLKKEVQLSVHCQTARQELHKLLADPEMVSSEIAETFHELNPDYPLALVEKGTAPSHIYYLQQLLNTLELSERAFHELEYLNLHRDQSHLEIYANIASKAPTLINDLFDLVVLIDQTPKHLEPCIAPIKNQLLPKLQVALNEIQAQIGPRKQRTIAVASSANTTVADIQPGRTIDESGSRQLIISSLFKLPAIISNFNQAISDQKPLVQLSPEQINVKMLNAHHQLENFIEATNGITNWYYYIQCIKEISVLGGSLLNNAHQFTGTISEKAIEKLGLIEGLIPKAIDELADIEMKFHLPQGILTKPGTIYAEQYFLLLNQYTEILIQTNMGLSDAKHQLKGNTGKVIQWITQDPISIEQDKPSDAISSFKAPISLQTHQFIQKRHQLIYDRRAELESNLYKIDSARTTFDEFYSMLTNICSDIEFQRKIQLTIKKRLALTQKYKMFRRYVIQTRPDIDEIIYQHLEVTTAEKLKLIAQCKLSKSDKKAIENCLRFEPQKIEKFIETLPYPKSTLETLKLLLTDSTCHSEEFITILPQLPDSLAEEYLPWCWYDELTIKDVLEDTASQRQAVTKPFNEQTWLETFSYGMSQVSLALYGVSVLASGVTHAWDLNTIFNARDEISANLDQECCDIQFSMEQLDRQVQNTLEIKFETDQTKVENHKQDLLKLHEQFTEEDTQIDKKLLSTNDALNKTFYMSRSNSALKKEIETHKKNKEKLQQKYLEQKNKIEENIKNIIIPTYSNTHYETIVLPENYETLSPDELKKQLRLFATQEQLLLQQQTEINSLFEVLETDEKPRPQLISELPQASIEQLSKHLFSSQTLLNSSSSRTIDYEKVFIDALTPPCHTPIETLLSHKTALMSKVKHQINQLQADKLNLETSQRKQHKKHIAYSPFVRAPEDMEHQNNLGLFKSITSLQLESKVNKLRTETIPSKLTELLSKEVLKKINLEDIKYPIQNIHAHTQTEAIYLHLLNALYHLEKSLKSFDDLQKLSESGNIFMKGYHIYTIISELVVNTYNAYYYFTADQKHPKIQTLFSEALKIISPLEELPILAPHIASARQAIKSNPSQPQTSIPTGNIIEAWQNQMHIVQTELGHIEFSIDKPLLAIEDTKTVENEMVEKTQATTKEEEPVDLLKNAYWALEKALQQKDSTISDEQVMYKANAKSKLMRSLAQKLSFASPDTVKSLIVEASEIISNISKVVYDEPTLRQNIMELTERSLNKLYRISDNTETSLGLKPSMISGKATKEFFKWINELIKPTGLEVDTNSIEHLHFIVLSNNKRLKNLENKIISLKNENVSHEVKIQLFGEGDNATGSPFNIIASMENFDFSDSKEGKKNRETFLINYEKIQHHLCQLDYTFDTSLFLREQLQSSKNFKKACAKIVALRPELHRYINTIDRDTYQQIAICKEHINQLKQQRKKNIHQLFKKAQQNSIALEAELFDGNIQTHHASNSLLAKIHHEYLQSYHYELNNHKQTNRDKESFRIKLANIEQERSNAIELYRIGSDMLKLFEHLSSKLDDPKVVEEQYIKDKKIILNELSDKLSNTLFDSPELSVVEQEQQLKAIYKDFEAKSPQLYKFTDNSFKQFIYDCLSYLNQRFGSFKTQQKIDNLFISATDQDFSNEIANNSVKNHKIFNFFSSNETEQTPDDQYNYTSSAPRNSE